MNSLLDNLKISIALQAIVANDDTEGKGLTIDTDGYGLTAFALLVGISGDTLSGSVKLQPKLQESDTTTDGDFTDVDSADVIESTLALVDDPAEDDVVQVVEYKGDKRYVRLVNDFTGTHTNGIPLGAIAIQGNPRISE